MQKGEAGMQNENNTLIFIAASWKQRKRVRRLAEKLRQLNFGVYDFTDPSCRKAEEIPPEKFPEQFDPERHNYWEYLDKPEWNSAIEENRQNLDCCQMLVLLLPCGIDATADWAYAIGKGKRTFIIGHPNTGERSPVHLWTDKWFSCEKEFLAFIKQLKKVNNVE